MINKVDDCSVCEPIKYIIDFLLSHNFEVVEQKVSDYHFHELFFKLKGKEVDIPVMNNITQHSKLDFVCECHWSTINLNFTPTDV